MMLHGMPADRSLEAGGRLDLRHRPKVDRVFAQRDRPRARGERCVERHVVLIRVRDPFTGVLWIVIPLPHMPRAQVNQGQSRSIKVNQGRSYLPNMPRAQQDFHSLSAQLGVLAERGHVQRRLAFSRGQSDGARLEAE